MTEAKYEYRVEAQEAEEKFDGTDVPSESERVGDGAKAMASWEAQENLRLQEAIQDFERERDLLSSQGDDAGVRQMDELIKRTRDYL